MSSYCRQFDKKLNPKIATNISELVIGSKGRTDCHDMGTKGTPPYVNEHTQMLRSIRGDGPYVNHGQTVAESTMTCIMARESAYSGQEITWDQIMNSQLDLMPTTFDYDEKMGVPPLPVPGTYKFV
jgi:hypothetical protein